MDINNTENGFPNRMHKSYIKNSSKKASDSTIEADQKTENPNYSLIFNNVATVRRWYRSLLTKSIQFLLCSRMTCSAHLQSVRQSQGIASLAKLWIFFDLVMSR